MEIWEFSGQWTVSSYSLVKEKLNVSGFSDFSPEQFHLECFNCRANNNVQNYINSVQPNGQWKNQLPQLEAFNTSTKAALLFELKNTVTQPLPSLGFGGQQTPNFELPSFPLDSHSNSATSFSFTVSSSLATTSLFGIAPVFEGISAGCNPPASGVMPLPGNSSVVNSSSNTVLTAFGTFNAAMATSASRSSSTLFGQTASASGHNITSVSSAVTNNTTSGSYLHQRVSEELKLFEAKKFTMRKIPLKSPPLELLNV